MEPDGTLPYGAFADWHHRQVGGASTSDDVHTRREVTSPCDESAVFAFFVNLRRNMSEHTASLSD